MDRRAIGYRDVITPGGRLDGIRQHVAHANQLLMLLRDDFEAFDELDPVTLRSELSDDGRTERYFVNVRVEPPATRWGFEIGQLVHSLRVALDHLAWLLADTPTRDTAFPLGANAKDFAKQTAGMPPGAVAFLEQFTEANDPDMAARLKHLRQLDNTAKHRTLTVLTFGMRSTGLSGVPGGNERWAKPGEPITDGALWLTIDRTPANAHHDPKPTIKTYVAIAPDQAGEIINSPHPLGWHTLFAFSESIQAQILEPARRQFFPDEGLIYHRYP